MAEKKSEFERRREAFEKSWAAKGWNETIKLGDALRQDFPEKFQDIPRLITRLSSAYYNRGKEHENRGKFDDAIAEYTRAIEIKDDFFEAYRNRGMAYYRNGNYENAKADFDKAIEIKPNDAVAYENRANVYLKMEDYNNAIDDFDKAIEIGPHDPLIYHDRAEAVGRLEGEKATQKI